MKKVYSFLTALLVAMLLIPSQLNAQILSANFDDGVLPEDWIVEGNAGDYNWQPTTNYRYGDSGYAMYFNTYSASDGATAILKSPVFSLKDVTTTQMLKFVAYYYDHSSAVYNVCISTDAGATYSTVLANLHTQETSKWIEYEISLGEYAGQENLCIVFDCVGDWYGRHAFDNFEISPAPTCAKAKDLQAIDIKQTYATLTWKLVEGAGEFASDFAIKVTPVGEEEPYEYTAENLAADENGVYSYTIEEGELEPGAAHKFSVQGLCGAEDVAAVVESGVFYTACDVVDLPIEIDLRTAEVDPFFPCWSHNGTVSYLGQSYGSISGDYYGDSFYMVSPQLNQAANNIEVELEYSTYSASGFTYGVASSSDMSDFEELGHIAFDSESGTVVFNTAESTSADLNKVVVFKFDNTDPNIQSIIIREKPCCPKPMGVTVSVIDSANVSLSWSGVAEKFNVVWTDTLSGQSYNAEVTEKTYIIEGLKSATTYSFAVQAVNTSCPEGEQASEFSKTLYATTNCGVRDEAKFVEDFSYTVGYESVLPECWSESVEGLWAAYGSSGYEAKYVAFRESYLEDGVNSALLVTQPINIVTGGQYDVKFKMNRLDIDCEVGVGHLNVYVNSAPSLEGATLLGTVNRSYKQAPAELAAGWYDYSFNIPATVTGTTYIIFEGNKWEGYGSNIINLDDIAVVDAVACRKVTNLAFGEPTTNTIALTWDAEEGQAAWTVEYVVLKGEEVIVDTTSVPVTEKAYTFASLPSSSTLTIKGSIVANCDAENNSEKVEFSWTFQTDCDAVTLDVPFTEGFNTRELPLCWLSENTSGSTSYKWSTNSGSSYQFPGSGEGCAYLGSNSTASTAILTTPELVFEEETDYRIEFFAYRYEYAPTGHGIYVYLSEDPTNTEEAELLTYIPCKIAEAYDAEANGAWFNQPVVEKSGMYRIRLEFNTEDLTGKYVIFEGITNGNYYNNAIDELWIGEKPAIDRIYDFKVDSITADAARISFNEPTVTAFDVAYGPKGFNPDAEGVDIKTNCTENPYSLVGLADNTEYEVYLRARNGELVSAWTNFSVSFRTKCLPVDMTASTMFVEDFESYNVDGSDFGCWSKSTTFYVEDYGYFYDANYNTVYISAVDGEKWANTTSSPAYMFRAVELKAGENYSLSVYARDCYTSTSYVCNVSLGLATEPSTSAMNKLTTQTITKCGNAWDFVETFFTVEEDGVYYIAFGTEGSNNTLFDKVELKKHDIIPPTVEVAAVTSSSATFAITSNASAWDFYCSTEEFDPATLAEDVVTSLNEKTYTLEGLNAQTVYYYTFRAKEGDKVSGWSNVKFFQTACAEHALPFVEDFESFDASCWNIETNDPAGSFKWAINDTYSQEEFENADVVGHAMRVSYSRNKGSKTILATPTLAFAENTDYRIEFNVRRNNQYPGDTGEGIAVYLSNAPVVNAEATMLTIVPRLKKETSADLGFADCLYPIDALEVLGVDGEYVFQHITLDFNTADYAGKNYVIFEAVTYYGGEQYMDNITIAERALEAPAAPAVPTIQYGGGYFTADNLPVALTTTETRPNYILVTIDGSEPSFEGVMVGTTLPVPSGQQIPMTAESTTIKARGFLLTEDGQPYQTPAGEYIYSEVVEATFTKVSAPVAPEFTPAEGEYTGKVEVSIASATENVMIKYEFGGTEPTGRSATYSAPFELTETTVVSAIAFLTDAEGAPIMDVEGMPIASAATFAAYTIKAEVLTVDAPVFTPAPGDYLDQESMSVTLYCSTPDALIYWTYGEDATVNQYSFAYENAIPVDAGNNVISAVAILMDDDLKVVAKSEVVYATYNLKEEVVEPIEIRFNPAPGEYEGEVTVSIEYINAEGAVMKVYSIDGTDPMREYKEPIKLTETATVKARVLLSMSPSFTFSETVEATYTIKPKEEPIVVSAPVFTPAPGDYLDQETMNVTLYCSTPDALIYWTYGEDSTVNQYSFAYENPIPVDAENNVISAVAILMDDDLKVVAKSEVVYATYNLKEEVVEPVEIRFSPEPGEYTDEVTVVIDYINAENAMMKVYSIDGTDPMREYKEPITLTETTTVKARVLLSMSPFTFSETVEATYVIVPGVGVGMDEAQLAAVVYAKDGFVYVAAQQGAMVEVFTVQGQCIYSAEAATDLISVDALNADVVLVKVNGETVKVSVR